MDRARLIGVGRGRRAAVVAAGLVLVGGTALAGCGDDDGGSSPTTTATSGTAGVIGPVVLSADDTSTTVDVGRVVTFDLGDPGDGRYVAESSDPEVFRIDGEGGTDGSATYNAGGTAVAPGTAEVTVTAEGTTDGPADPVTFTITVE